MNDNLLVFQENTYYFGIFPEDFERHLPLEEVWINPTQHAVSLWNFEEREKSIEGVFVHMGALFGFSPIHFSYTGFIFLKEIPDIRFGVFMDNYIMRLPTRLASTGKIGIDQFHDLPPEIPKAAFRYVLLYKKKKILVVDPLMLLRSFNDLFPAKI